MDRDDDDDDFIDPDGRALYEEVLGKPVFDEQHRPPLVGLRKFTVNHLFARIWGKSKCSKGSQTVSLRERRLITIALLAAQGRTDQLKDHINGACRARVTETELVDLMIHVAHYAGWPAGNSGQRVVHDVFKRKNKAECVILFRAVTTSAKRQEFVDFLTWDKRVAMDTEPGTLRFDFFEDPSNPNAFYVYEAYADEEAFGMHRRNAPYLEWVAKWRKELELEEFFRK